MFEGLTFFLFVPSFVLSIAAYLYSMVLSFRSKRSRLSSEECTAQRVAREVFKTHQTKGIKIKPIPGEMTDHYNEYKKILYLSEIHLKSNTVYAAAVAAHDAAHAIQSVEKHHFPRLRNFFFGGMKILSNVAFPVFLIGFAFAQDFLTVTGVYLFAVVVAFHLLTYPVEYKANQIAMNGLKRKKVFKTEDLRQIEKMLVALSVSYLGAAFTSIFNLFKQLYLANKEKESRDYSEISGSS